MGPAIIPYLKSELILSPRRQSLGPEIAHDQNRSNFAFYPGDVVGDVVFPPFAVQRSPVPDTRIGVSDSTILLL